MTANNDIRPRLLCEHEAFELYIADIIPDTGFRQRAERLATEAIFKKRFGDITIGHDKNGAPYIVGLQDIKISISHCKNFCIAAISKTGRPIGVDIENPRAQLIRVKDRFLTDSEQKKLELIINKRAGNSGNTQRSKPTLPDIYLGELLRYWTIKEAVYKAALTPGLGLKEIETDSYGATARGERYGLFHLSRPSGEQISVAF